MKVIPERVEKVIRPHLSPIPQMVLDNLQLLKSQAIRLETIVTGLNEIAGLQRGMDKPCTLLQGFAAFDDPPPNLRMQIRAEAAQMEVEHLSLVIRHLVDHAYVHAQAADLSAMMLIGQTASDFFIAARDYGPGVAEEYRSRIFDPLYTLKSQDELKASGMGLAVIKRIAELYNGKCNALPKQDTTGTTFVLTIPCPAI